VVANRPRNPRQVSLSSFRSDNCIKNHFYSKLRKVLRKLNAVIHSHFRREFREISISVVYKLVEGCEEVFKESPACEKSVSLACRGAFVGI
jgi:hypothetical protein